MTLIGKVFTFLVLILSVVFFIVAAFINARHINYRDLVENKNTGLRVQLQKEQAKTSQLSELVERLRNDLAIEQGGRRMTVSTLETALAQKNQELVAKEQQLADEQAKTTLFETKILSSDQELAARSSENADLRKMLVDTTQDRNAQYQKFVQTYDQWTRLQGEKQTLDKQSKELARDFTASKQMLDILDITPKTKLDGPPAVTGVVSAVKNKMVEITLGRDDGILVGDELDVFHGSSHVGRLKITRSVADKAIGEAMQEHARGFIAVGDRVDPKPNELFVRRPQ